MTEQEIRDFMVLLQKWKNMNEVRNGRLFVRIMDMTIADVLEFYYNDFLTGKKDHEPYYTIHPGIRL